MRTRCLTALLAVLLAAAAVTAAEPGRIEDLVLAGSDDQAIRAVLAETLPLATAQFAEFGSDAAQVYAQHVYSTTSQSYRIVDNSIWWVKEGQAEDLSTYLRDYSRSWDITEVRAFVIRPGEYSVDAALAAPIERLPADRIRLQKSSAEGKLTNLVVAFQSAGPGDVLGVSIAAKVRHRLRWYSWFLAGERPLARAEMRLICDNKLAYIVFGQGLAQGQMQQDVLYQDHGQIRDLVVRADAVAPLLDEPYSLPWRDQSPCLRVVWRGTAWSWDGKHRIWGRYDEWNQVAADMAAVERHFLSKTKRSDKLARELTAGLGPVAAADSLYRFVRDDLQTVGTGQFDQAKDDPTVEDVLKVRAGSEDEKAYLLVAMLRAVDVPAELVWAHDPDDGHLFTKYPSWGQVDVPFVKAAVGGSERWYDLGCGACPPGEIRPLLQGSDAMTYVRDADEQDTAITDDLVEKAFGRQVDFVSMYLRRIATLKWHTLTNLPGRTGAVAGYYRERIRLGDAGAAPTAGTAELQATTFMPLGTRLSEADDRREAAGQWFRERFPAAREDTLLGLGNASGDTIEASFGFTIADLPAPMGDTWILPTSLLMGSRCIDSWPDERTKPFSITEQREYVWETSLPLPTDWTDVQLPSHCAFGFRCLQYEAGFQVRDGRLVLLRHLVERPIKVSSQPELDQISREVRKIIAFESTPVVLQRGRQGP